MATYWSRMVITNDTIMEPKTKNLYRVRGKGWSNPCYVAADSQQEAVDKIGETYESENKFHLSVEYVDDVYV